MEALYEEVLQSRGLRIRAGITLDDCGIVLAAVADGLALRALADPAAPVIDHARRRCLLGTAVLALIAGCVERAEDGDGLPLEEAAHALVCGAARGLRPEAGLRWTSSAGLSGLLIGAVIAWQLAQGLAAAEMSRSGRGCTNRSGTGKRRPNEPGRAQPGSPSRRPPGPPAASRAARMSCPSPGP